MTVLNTEYSTIEEAWGEPYLSPSLQKKKRKKSNEHQDPICELYAMGNNHYQDSDIVSYANQYFEKHDKPRYQKPMMLQREKENPRRVEIHNGNAYAYGAPYSDDEPVAPPSSYDEGEEKTIVSEATPPSQSVYVQEQTQQELSDFYNRNERPRRNVIHDTHEYYVSEEDPDYYKKDTAFNMMDVILYILSGIILIFMMEQFVKIGTMMH